MPLELRWKVSLSASCIHAALCRRQGIAAADPQLAAALDQPADALIYEIQQAGWPVDAVLEQLASFAAEIDNNRELVSRVLARLRIAAAGEPVVRVSGAVADLEAALRREQPDLAEELPLRERPLREQWEARGPGLLMAVGRLTEAAAVPEAAEVALVAPYAGGHGVAHAGQNRVTFEAVLVNPLPELPEVVRLAWLIAQLNSDLPQIADVVRAPRAPAVMSVAMIPPVLAAAELVELGRCDAAAIAEAIVAWRLPPALPPDAADRLWSWWTAWLEGAAKWPVAVAALDELLA